MQAIYLITKLKGGSFKTDSLVYAVDRFTADKNISTIQNVETGEVILQRIKDKEKLNSQAASWKAIQTQ